MNRGMERWLRSQYELDLNEKIALARIQQVYAEVFKTELPPSLSLGEPAVLSDHVVKFMRSPQHDRWSSELKDGVFKAKAQKLVHIILRFFQQHSNPQKLDTTIPTYMFYHELLSWIRETLSNAPCDINTHSNIKSRREYLARIRDSNLLSFDDRVSPCIGVLSALERELSTLLSAIERVRDNKVRADLHSVTIDNGKKILRHNFNILYFLLSDLEDLPYPEVSLFCAGDPIYARMGKTRAGKLLTVLAQSPEFRFLFPEQPLVDSEVIESGQGISTNPFQRSQVRSLIPLEFLQGAGSCATDYSDFWKSDDKEGIVGISKLFKKDASLLELFLKAYALTKDFATAVVLYHQASTNYTGVNTKQCIVLVGIIFSIAKALKECQNDLSNCLGKYYFQCNDKTDTKTKKQNERWMKNYINTTVILRKLSEVIDSFSDRCAQMYVLLNVEENQDHCLVVDHLTPDSRQDLDSQTQTEFVNPADYFFANVPMLFTHNVRESSNLATGKESVYTAFGVSDRVEAYQCLFQHITSVRNIVKPVLQEVLFANEKFVSWLSDEYPGLKKASADYRTALVRNDSEIQLYWDRLNGFCEDLNLVDQFIVYDVLHKRVDRESVHPLILCALAQARGVALRLYEIYENGDMIPHSRYKGHSPAGATETIELLVTENNSYQKVELKPAESVKEESKPHSNFVEGTFSETGFAGGATYFQPVSEQLEPGSEQRLKSEQEVHVQEVQVSDKGSTKPEFF